MDVQRVPGYRGFRGTEGSGVQSVPGYRGFRGTEGSGVQRVPGYRGFRGTEGSGDTISDMKVTCSVCGVRVLVTIISVHLVPRTLSESFHRD